jgi:hypothetical protein
LINTDATWLTCSVCGTAREACTVLGFRKMFPLEDAIGSHVCLGLDPPFVY